MSGEFWVGNEEVYSFRAFLSTVIVSVDAVMLICLKRCNFGFLIVFLHQINAIWKMHYCLAQCPAFLPAFQNNFTNIFVALILHLENTFFPIHLKCISP